MRARLAHRASKAISSIQYRRRALHINCTTHLADNASDVDGITHHYCAPAAGGHGADQRGGRFARARYDVVAAVSRRRDTGALLFELSPNTWWTHGTRRGTRAVGAPKAPAIGTHHHSAQRSNRSPRTRCTHMVVIRDQVVRSLHVPLNTSEPVE